MWLSAARDVAIILLAFESLVIGGLLVFLLFEIRRLVRLLEEEVKPLLSSMQKTADTVRGTTSFVSENVVSPVVRVHSVFAGITGAAKALFKSRSER
jgi:hypothetical protein